MPAMTKIGIPARQGTLNVEIFGVNGQDARAAFENIHTKVEDLVQGSVDAYIGDERFVYQTDYFPSMKMLSGDYYVYAQWYKGKGTIEQRRFYASTIRCACTDLSGEDYLGLDIELCLWIDTMELTVEMVSSSSI